MKNSYKVIAIIDFFAAVCWLVCVVFDIVDEDFSTKFFIHLAGALVFAVNGFVYLRKNKPVTKGEYLDDNSKENTK